MESPTVFISYSRDSPEHEGRVLALANRLRADGIDAVLDQFESFPTEGWPVWMERQVEAARFVLVVCTPTYRRRAEGKEEPGESTRSSSPFCSRMPTARTFRPRSRDTRTSRFTPKRATRIYAFTSRASLVYESLRCRRSSASPIICTGTSRRAIRSSPAETSISRDWNTALPTGAPRPSAVSVESARRRPPSSTLTAIGTSTGPCSGVKPIPATR